MAGLEGVDDGLASKARHAETSCVSEEIVGVSGAGLEEASFRRANSQAASVRSQTAPAALPPGLPRAEKEAT